MGASSREAHAIEPASGDLLMPDRIRRPRALRPRDVEDACFETIGAPGGSLSDRPSADETSGVFKSRLTRSPEHGPFPSDFACSDRISRQDAGRNGRLGVFGGEGTPLSSRGSRPSLAASALVLVMCGIAAAAFWISGDLAPASPSEARAQAPISATPAASAASNSVQAPPTPDPEVPSSVADGKAASAKSSYTTPAPRPARIERAGSILMIRPGGS
ncbi:hypothetical protein [Hoeflea sp.]|uniref:hypothetical protein n=1 Tax=Hoeflea sp. TaxID=1940281 RepID=UPI00199DC20F|nr:hypothetical protein [Hoeflea sp.]MBC7283736.1 hypothetical protein [Hoeflea sp.]